MADKQLVTLFEQYTTQLELLRDILREERELLEKDDTKALTTIAERKNPILETVQQLEDNLKATFNSNQLEFSKQGLEELIAQHRLQEQIDLRSAWGKLKTLLAEVQRANVINGNIAAISYTNIEAIVDLLKGRDPSFKMYSKQGKLEKTRGTNGHSAA